MKFAKYRSTIIVIIASIVLLTGVPGAYAGSSHAAQINTSVVHLFSDGSIVGGSSSKLMTNDAGASMTLHTSGLTAGHPVTVWWVIFNKPEFCAGPSTGHPFRCGITDLSNPKVEASVMFSAGHMIGGDGIGNYGAHLKAGDTSGCVTTPVVLPCGHGLTNPRGADIHLVVHDHGSVSPDQISAAIHGFCPCTYPPDSHGRTWRDIQFAVHEQ